jgi:hypothetical protein
MFAKVQNSERTTKGKDEIFVIFDGKDKKIKLK